MKNIIFNDYISRGVDFDVKALCHRISLVRQQGDNFPFIMNMKSNIYPADASTLIDNTIDSAETPRRIAAEQLSMLSCAVEQNPCSIIITDISGNIKYVNHKFTKLTGYTPEEVVGQNSRILKSGKIPPEEYKRMWNTITSGSEWHGEFQNKKKSGKFYWVHASISPVKDSNGIITHFLAVIEDINERKHLETKLVNMAERDPLTNLFNRRRFEEELEDWLAQAKRYTTHGALLFIDLDNFKRINDTFGHYTGDKLLKTVANTLQKRLRYTDTLARFGGDEFAIILQHTNIGQAQLIAGEMLGLLKYNTEGKEGKCPVITASIGIALFPEHSASLETLIAYADLAMYNAKEQGGNRVCVYSDDQEMQIELRLKWKNRICYALENDRFVLHLQPILNLRENRIVRHEALLRMIGENGELIPPSVFLNVAERFGLIHEIDRWVVCKAINIIAELRRTGKFQCLEVNLSGKTIANTDFLSQTRQQLETTDTNPSNLILGIPENAIVENAGEIHSFITSFKDIGCRFALDDYGRFSSFNHLNHLPIDYLRISGSFISDLPNNRVHQHLVRGMVEVARGLGKQIIANYVSSDETLQLLQEYDVDYAQGYHIGLPTAISEIQKTS